MDQSITDGRGEQEDVDGRVRVEPVDERHPEICRNRSIESQIRDVWHLLQQIRLDDVHHGLQLTEQKDAVLIYDGILMKK